MDNNEVVTEEVAAVVENKAQSQNLWDLGFLT